MTRERCIIHANCQGEPLLERLNRCPEFADRFEARIYVNYVREPIPDRELRECSLFLYQHLGDRWDDLASSALLARLPAGARSLCIPNMFFKGYWPMWDGRAGFDYRCSLLDEVVDLGLTPEETLVLFLRTDVARKYDLDALYRETLEREREREARTPVKYVHLIAAHGHETRLFNTVNHPGPLLLNHAAVEILHRLGFTPPAPEAFEALPAPFPEFEQPIHPKVAAHFGWPFAGQDAEYNIYGRPMTFARYAAHYVTARKAGIGDFIGFLQGDPSDG
ncbi:MAG: WcbI family polysaccharide biosynthesis putative acetyltransferase [Pseudodesulfovibrio sp.]